MILEVVQGLRMLRIGASGRPSHISTGTACHYSNVFGCRAPSLLLHCRSLQQAQKKDLLRSSQRSSRQKCSAASRDAAAAASSEVAVFPAGRKQAKVVLPAFIIIMSAAEVLQRRHSIAEEIGAAVSAGATGILLGDAQGLGEYTLWPYWCQTCHAEHW